VLQCVRSVMCSAHSVLPVTSWSVSQAFCRVENYRGVTSVARFEMDRRIERLKTDGSCKGKYSEKISYRRLRVSKVI
jgi:hypothetical protein